MESMRSETTIIGDEIPPERKPTSQQFSENSKEQALKSKLKTSFSKSSHKLFKSTPTTFSRFAELPDEIQVLIIKFALGQRELIPVIRPSNPQVIRRTGWWSVPHQFLSVSRKFRLETLRLRPRSFAIGENLPSKKILAAPQIDFDFSRDLLVVPQIIFEIPDGQPGYRIYGVEKLDTVVISWTHCDFQKGVVRSICGIKNIKTVVLIHQALLEQKKGRCYYTTEGPFWKGENWAKARLQEQFNNSGLRPGAEAPKVFSMRLMRHYNQPTNKVYAWVRNVRDYLVVQRFRWRGYGSH
jgi:hypothetical protein